MSQPRAFPKCGICGTHGHTDVQCPVAALNAEQEAASRDRITAEMLFPGNPGLVELLKAIQKKWEISPKMECGI